MTELLSQIQGLRGQISRADLQGPGWADRRMNGRKVGRTKVPLCSTGLSPLRGRCPASPSLQFTITQSRATGIADHVLPLGDLLHYCSCPTVCNWIAMFLVFWAAAPKGSMTYAFSHMGNFVLILLLLLGSGPKVANDLCFHMWGNFSSSFSRLGYWP